MDGHPHFWIQSPKIHLLIYDSVARKINRTWFFTHSPTLDPTYYLCLPLTQPTISASPRPNLPSFLPLDPTYYLGLCWTLPTMFASAGPNLLSMPPPDPTYYLRLHWSQLTIFSTRWTQSTLFSSAGPNLLSLPPLDPTYYLCLRWTQPTIFASTGPNLIFLYLLDAKHPMDTEFIEDKDFFQLTQDILSQKRSYQLIVMIL